MTKFFRTFIASLREPGSLKTLIFHSSWALTLTSGLSYFLGFLRDRIFAHTFGLSRTLDIYNAAFVVPDTLLQVIVMAALSAPFIPIFAKLYDKEKNLGFRYANQFITWGLILIAMASVLIGFFLPHFTNVLVPGFTGKDVTQYIFLTRLLLLSPFLFALSNVYGRMLLSVREFFWWGMAPALYNLGIVAGALLLGKTLGALGLILGTLFGIVLHISVNLIVIRRPKYGFRSGIDFTFSPELKETVWLTLPKLLQYGMVSVMLIAFTSIATELGEGAVAAYNYARNFQSIPVSLLGIAISLAAYPSLCHDAGKGDFVKFRKDFKRDVIRLIVYTSLAGVALAVISLFLVKILLGGGKFTPADVRLVATVLQIYCLSVPLESLMYMYHRAFYALMNTAIPSLLHAGIMMATIVFAKIATPHFGIYAIPLGFTAGLLLQVFILSLWFPIALRKSEQTLAI